MHVSPNAQRASAFTRSLIALAASLALALGMVSCAPASSAPASSAGAQAVSSASADASGSSSEGASGSASSASASASSASSSDSAAAATSAPSASASAAASSGSTSAQAAQAKAADFDYADYPRIVSHDYDPPDISVDESGTYSSKDEVALYIHKFGHLPSNYLGKTKARKAGWVAKEGNLWDVLPGMSIGGSEWYNDDGDLPEKPGRVYHECDIDYQGGYRNAQRIVYSSDGLVFYTDDHYNTFEQLY